MLKILCALKKPQKEVISLLEDHAVDIISEYESIEEIIVRKNYDIILLQDDIDILSHIKNIDPRIEIIFFGDNDLDAIDAIKKGASAFFSLSSDKLERLKTTIDSISNFIEMNRDTAELEKILRTRYTFAGVVGKNPRMLDIFALMRCIAPYFKVVTIIGETGTGKEVIAKALHSLSPASKNQFIICDCGAIADNLIESELFGHRKGSFTGAIKDKIGLFEAAGEGTIFLDEIGDLPLSSQASLLRVLQSNEFRKIGDNQLLKAKCKVIAATNKNLQEECKKGNFREDLYYRLTPLSINVPPLRERKDDIPLLYKFFLEKFSSRTGKKVHGLSRPAQNILMSYDWPGNVRELENTIEQAAILTTETFIRLDDLPAHLKTFGYKKEQKTRVSSIDDVIKRHIEETLVKCEGNRTKAAKLLQISRRALIRKIEKYSVSLDIHKYH
ncbi:MAG: sigma-54-dependent Fis family transcriptional regulator [Nitrospirae bacterium]|nr:sigma-54-dependent Fis family transcriptional regulator [Nitrospirota bacterium]